MGEISNAERAERLSTRRARMLPAIAFLLIAQQSAYLAGQRDPVERWVDWVSLSAWVVLSIVILLILVTGGFWLKPSAVRRLVDDEVTRAARAESTRLGFIVAILGAIALHVLAAFEPIDARMALQIVITFGLVAALLRFAFLERRAHDYG
jgi:heme/copper-type cytochrome/quinol oxidase subunit 2